MEKNKLNILGRHAEIMKAVYDRINHIHKRPLHMGQIQVAKDYFNNNKRVIQSQWSRNGGKALCLKTPILTTKGWKTMAQIKVGDYVFAVDGTPSRVCTISPVMYDHDCYDVKFNDGSSIIADAEHRWLTSNKSSRSSKKKNKGKMYNRSPVIQPAIRTTEEIANTLMKDREYNHTIETCKPISIPPGDLEVDPYVLGAWLGDGKQDAGYIYSIDAFIVNEFEKMGFPATKTKRDYEYSFKNLFPKISALGLKKNKHIPEKYLLAGNSQRLALLQGLMDTDGYVDKTGRTNFCNTNKDIAYGVKFLAESLGMRASLTHKQPKKGKLAYIIEIVANQQIFRLPRKAKRLEPKIGKRKGTNRRTIVSVEKVKSVPVKCIGIEHESHLYLAGKSLVPTHNTECALFIATVACLLNDNFQVMIIAPELKQAKKIYWHKKRLQNYPPPQFIKDMNTTDMKVEFKNGSTILVDGCENYEGLRGVKPNLVIYDEFQHHSKEFHLEVMQPNLMDINVALIVFGTPPKKRSAYYVEFRQQLLDRIKAGDTVSSYYEFDATINPVNDKEELQKLKKTLFQSDNQAIWYREYEGKLVFGGEDVVFPRWDPAIHVRPHGVVLSYINNDKSKLKWFTICDPGTSTCFAVLFLCYNAYTQQIFILDEIYEKDRSKTDSRQIWNRIRAKEQELYPEGTADTWKRYYDEAAAWFYNEIASMHKGMKLNLSPSRKQHTNEETDISRIKMAMSQPGAFVVSDRCYWLRWEIESFITILDKAGDVKYTEQNQHLIDCLKYFMQVSNWSLMEKAEDIVYNANQIVHVNSIQPQDWANDAVYNSLNGDSYLDDFFH